jgi:hypothetical protein
MLHAGFLPGLLFDPEDGGDMFVRNVSWLETDYTVLNPRRQNSSSRIWPVGRRRNRGRGRGTRRRKREGGGGWEEEEDDDDEQEEEEEEEDERMT